MAKVLERNEGKNPHKKIDHDGSHNICCMSQGEIKASQQVCLRQVSFSPLMAMSFVSLLIQPAERVYRL